MTCLISYDCVWKNLFELKLLVWDVLLNGINPKPDANKYDLINF